MGFPCFYTIISAVTHWLDSDKELIELINCQLTVSSAENPHLMLIYE